MSDRKVLCVRFDVAGRTEAEIQTLAEGCADLYPDGDPDTLSSEIEVGVPLRELVKDFTRQHHKTSRVMNRGETERAYAAWQRALVALLKRGDALLCGTVDGE